MDSSSPFTVKYLFALLIEFLEKNSLKLISIAKFKSTNLNVNKYLTRKFGSKLLYESVNASLKDAKVETKSFPSEVSIAL